ncbi:hypothetical protein ZWY2020_024667 [Hordeum vulgare]|nr:hypothetical protein ZWY2020_024667 [Hordeum vulgare]
MASAEEPGRNRNAAGQRPAAFDALSHAHVGLQRRAPAECAFHHSAAPTGALALRLASSLAAPATPPSSAPQPAVLLRKLLFPDLLLRLLRRRAAFSRSGPSSPRQPGCAQRPTSSPRSVHFKALARGGRSTMLHSCACTDCRRMRKGHGSAYGFARNSDETDDPITISMLQVAPTLVLCLSLLPRRSEELLLQLCLNCYVNGWLLKADSGHGCNFLHPSIQERKEAKCIIMLDSPEKDKTAEERRMAICIFDDIAEQCKCIMIPIFPFSVGGINDDNSDVTAGHSSMAWLLAYKDDKIEAKSRCMISFVQWWRDRMHWFLDLTVLCNGKELATDETTTRMINVLKRFQQTLPPDFLASTFFHTLQPQQQLMLQSILST